MVIKEVVKWQVQYRGNCNELSAEFGTKEEAYVHGLRIFLAQIENDIGLLRKSLPHSLPVDVEAQIANIELRIRDFRQEYRTFNVDCFAKEGK